MSAFARFSTTDAIRANLRQRSVRGALFSAAGQGLDFVMRMVSLAVLARLLKPESFGLLAMVLALTGILESVKDLGLATATMQRDSVSHELVSNLFWTNALAGGAFAAILFVAAPWIAAFYQEPRLIEITMAIALTFLWTGASAQHEALLIRQLRQGELALIRFVANLLSFLAAVWMALNGWGYWALVWREVIRTAMMAIGVWVRCPWLPSRPRRVEGTASLLRFGRDFTLAQVAHIAVSSLDRLLVGKLFGAAPLGEYRLAHQTVVTTTDQFSGPIGSVANAGMSMIQHDPSRYRRYFQKVVFLTALCTMPIAVYGALYSAELTHLLFGSGWSSAATFFALFAASAFVRPVQSTLSTVLISRGQSSRLLRMMLGNKLLFCICLAVAYRRGPAAIAAVHLVCPLLAFLPNARYALSGTPISIGDFFRPLRAPALASLVMGAVLLAGSLLLPASRPLYTIVFSLVAACALYFGCLLLLPASRRELGRAAADLAGAAPPWAARILSLPRRTPHDE